MNVSDLRNRLATEIDLVAKEIAALSERRKLLQQRLDDITTAAPTAVVIIPPDLTKILYRNKTPPLHSCRKRDVVLAFLKRNGTSTRLQIAAGTGYSNQNLSLVLRDKRIQRVGWGMYELKEPEKD